MGARIHWSGILLWLASAVISPPTLAESPFAIQGLHIDLTTGAAAARAEELGGVCDADPRARASDNFRLHCEFLPCMDETTVATCRRRDRDQPSLKIAGQTVIRIGLEAQEADAPLDRIAILFEGDHLAVAEALAQQYGKPILHGTPGETSWTHSRRMSWSESGYRMAVLNAPHLILLARDIRQPQPSDATPK